MSMRGDHMLQVKRENLGHVVSVICPMCQQEKSVELTWEQYDRWLDGTHVQEFNLPPSLAELLISGTCAECWAKLAPPMEDEETTR